MMSIHKALVLLVAGLLVQGCGNLIKGDVDETPRLEQVDENVCLINFNAYDVGKALETLNGEDLAGRNLTVNEARPKPDRGGGGGRGHRLGARRDRRPEH